MSPKVLPHDQAHLLECRQKHTHKIHPSRFKYNKIHTRYIFIFGAKKRLSHATRKKKQEKNAQFFGSSTALRPKHATTYQVHRLHSYSFVKTIADY